MPQLTSPFVEGKYGWTLGESGWNVGMDENLLKFSYMCDRNIDGIVTSLPPAVNGKAYFHSSENRVYYVVDGTYYSSPVPKWAPLYEKTTGVLYQFNGSSLIQQPNISSIDTRLTAVESVQGSLGSAAFLSSTDFIKTVEAVDTTNPSLGAALLAKSSIYVDSINDLLNQSRTLPHAYVVKGYHPLSVEGGGIFVWDAANTAASDGGTVIAVPGVTTGRFVRVLDPSAPRTPEMFGAVGDDITLDTDAIIAWYSSSNRLIARKKYRVSPPDTGFVKQLTTDDSFYLDLTGSSFTPTNIIRDLFKINSDFAVDEIRVTGGLLSCSDKIARPLTISGSGSAKKVSVDNMVIDSVKENGQSYSTFGIFISLEAASVKVVNNSINGVSRTTTSGGVSCQGISVNNLVGQCHIYGNIVNNVRTPSTVDADGIVAFSKNRLISPSEVQPVDLRIYNNRLLDCQDRFIKLQSPGKVYKNWMRTTIAITDSFRAVDAQFGGVDCDDNEWRCAAVTGGNDAVFYMYQGQGATGAEENVGFCRGNKLYLAREIRYLCLTQVTGGAHQVYVDDNVSKGAIVSHHEQLTRLILPATAAAVTSVAMRVSGNVYEGNDGSHLILTGGAASDVGINTKLKLDVYDNDPGAVTSGFVEMRHLDTAAPGYFGDFLLRANGKHPNATVINALGVDINNLRPGNEFYYGTDGSTGGMLNTASGYNRFVHVSITVREIKLESNSCQDRVVKLRGASTWYRLQGTAI